MEVCVAGFTPKIPALVFSVAGDPLFEEPPEKTDVPNGLLVETGMFDDGVEIANGVLADPGTFEELGGFGMENSLLDGIGTFVEVVIPNGLLVESEDFDDVVETAEVEDPNGFVDV